MVVSRKFRAGSTTCITLATASIFGGVMSLLVSFAVYSPAYVAESRLANRLQQQVLLSIHDDVNGFLARSKSHAEVAAEAIAYDLQDLDDSWVNVEHTRPILWGCLLRIRDVASSGFASASDLSTVFFWQADGTVTEYKRNKTGSPYMHVYDIDSFGHCIDAPPAKISMKSFSTRDWYKSAAARCMACIMLVQGADCAPPGAVFSSQHTIADRFLLM
jgi:hypothetical protein